MTSSIQFHNTHSPSSSSETSAKRDRVSPEKDEFSAARTRQGKFVIKKHRSGRISRQKINNEILSPDDFICHFINSNYFFNNLTQSYKLKTPIIDYRPIALSIKANCGACVIETLAERHFFGNGGIPVNAAIGYEIIRHGIALGFKPAEVILDQQRRRAFGLHRSYIYKFVQVQTSPNKPPVHICTIPKPDQIKLKKVDQSISHLITIDRLIQRLSLERIKFDENGIHKIIKALGSNSSLTELTFDKCEAFDHGVILGSYISANKTLRSFSVISHQKITRYFISSIISGLKSNNTLNLLHLESSYNSEEDEEPSRNDYWIPLISNHLEQMIALNQSLHTLRLINLGNPQLPFSIANSLHLNRFLTTLDLSNNNIGKEGGLALAACLRYNFTLQSLSLCHNSLSDSVGTEIAQSLTTNGALTELRLDSINISDETGMAFAQALTTNTTLKTLTLYPNPFSQPTLMAFGQSLIKNSTLTHFPILDPYDDSTRPLFMTHPNKSLIPYFSNILFCHSAIEVIGISFDTGLNGILSRNRYNNRIKGTTLVQKILNQLDINDI